MNTNFEIVDCVVIGAGVVGLAVARKLAQSGLYVLVLECEKSIGQGISSRNSEVIHAGIYYPEESLKANLCVRGKKLLYDYAKTKGISYKNCGKLIVAVNTMQIPELESLNEKARNNGVHDLKYLSQEEITVLEPDIRCVSALFSPSTGIIDSHEFMVALQGDIENAGGQCVYLSKITSWEPHNDGVLLHVNSQGEKISILTQKLINCAGINAVQVASSFEEFPENYLPALKMAKGNYFSLEGSHNFKHLIYPVPEQDGLGVHLTLDMQGKAKFGPDVEWIDDIDFTVCPDRADSFYAAIRQYWPGLKDAILMPDYAGIRPKIFIDGKAYSDFLIQDKTAHGIKGLINLFGIESPGLTSSMAIGEKVYSML